MKKLLTAAALVFSQAALALPLQNTGFETNTVGNFEYGNAAGATGWDLQGGGGVSYNSAAWSGYTPYGNYFAFLQNTASATQIFTVADAGSYALDFFLRQRTNTRIGGLQTVSVTMDGTQIWFGTPTDSWAAYGVAAVALTAGSHTLSFLGTNQNAAYDTTAFVDNISLNRNVPEPAPAALAGLGLLAFLASRRRA